MNQTEELVQYKRQRNKYDFYTVVLPMLLSIGAGIPLIYLNYDANIIISVVIFSTIVSSLCKAFFKKPAKPLQSTEEIINQQVRSDSFTEISTDKIKILPDHQYNDMKNLGLWLIWALIGLPFGVGIIAILGEYFLYHQNEVLTKNDIIIMAAFVAAAVFINWLMYKLIKESKNVSTLYNNRVFDGIEFSPKGICFDIMSVDRITQSWMIKNQVSHYALGWADVEKVSFLAFEKHHESSTPALFQITPSAAKIGTADNLKEYILKYNAGICIFRKYLQGHEKAIIALLNKHTKVQIDIQDALY